MAGPISMATASLFAVFLDLVLGGAYTVIFVLTLWITRERRWHVSLPFAAIYLSYLLNVARSVMLVVASNIVYIHHLDWASEYFESPNTQMPPTPFARFDRYSWIVIAFTANVTLCWRLYIIWSRSYIVIILPGLLMTAAAVLTFTGTYPARPTNTVFRQITSAAFALDLLMDWVMTGLIAGKLWWAGRTTYYDRNRTAFGRVALGFMESGALTSVGMIVMLITFGCDTNGAVIIWTAMPKISGITSTAIVLLLNLGFKQPADTIPCTNTCFVFRNPNEGRSGAVNPLTVDLESASKGADSETTVA